VIGKGWWEVLSEVEEKHRDRERDTEREKRASKGVRAIKRPQKWRSSFKRSGRRERAKVCVRKRGHKSGAAVLREAGRRESERWCACEKEATKVAQQFYAKREERERAQRCGCEKEATKVAHHFYAKREERREQRF